MRREPPPPQPQPLPPAEGPSPPPPPPPPLDVAPPGATIRGSYWPLGGSYWPANSWWAPPLRTTSLLRRLGPIGLLCRRMTGPISRLISRLIWPISSWLCRRAAAHWPSRPALLRSGAAHDDLSPPPPYPPHPAYPSSPLVKAAALGGGAVVGGLAELPALGTLDADAFGACLQPLALMDLLGARSVSRAWAVTLTPHLPLPTSTPTPHLSTPPPPAPSPEPSPPPSPSPSPSPSPHPLPSPVATADPNSRPPRGVSSRHARAGKSRGSATRGYCNCRAAPTPSRWNGTRALPAASGAPGRGPLAL